MATTYLGPDELAKRRKEIEAAKKLQAEQCEKEKKEKEAERKALKEKEAKWLQTGIDTKNTLNRSLIAKQKEVVSKTKGIAMSNCLLSWPKDGQQAGEYDKKGYIVYIKSVKSVDDPKYDNLIQINAAMDNVDKEQKWSVLKDMIECLL